MHPSVYAAAEADHRRRRVAHKRGRKASCSAAAVAAPSLTYQIPSMSKMDRRSSFSGSSSSQITTHSRKERRSSCSSTASLSDSYSTTSSSSSMKSCSFVEDPEIIHVPAATTLTGESLWYQKEDFDNFRKKIHKIINNVDQSGRAKNGKKYCTRGLEKYMARAQENRQNLRKSILGAMDEDESAASSTSHKSEKPNEAARENQSKPTSFRKKILPWMRKSHE